MVKTAREKSEGMGVALGISALLHVGQAIEVADARAQRNAERLGRLVAEARGASERARAERAEALLRAAQDDLVNKQAQCDALLSDLIEARPTISSAQREAQRVNTELAAVRQEAASAGRRASTAESRASTAEARASTAEARVRELQAELARRAAAEEA